MQTYKIVIIGDKNTGKTSFVRRHLNGIFLTDYEPTLGVEVHPLVFNTNYGDFGFNIWDTAGDDKKMGLVDGYYISADGAIIFYTSDSNYDKTKKLVEKFLELNPHKPIVNVWNKSDLPDEQSYILNAGYQYITQGKETYQVSAKSNYNYEKPFLYLLRNLTNKSNLSIC